MIRKSLSDILTNQDILRDAWEKTEAASEFSPLPAGEYIARIEHGELTASKSNSTPGFKLTFKVLEGEHAGRRFWHDVWLTAAALPMAKRDLAKIGIVSLDQLEKPLPCGIVCHVKLALRTEDEGTQYNRVKSFDVLRTDQPEADSFAPESPEDLEGSEF